MTMVMTMTVTVMMMVAWNHALFETAANDINTVTHFIQIEASLWLHDPGIFWRWSRTSCGPYHCPDLPNPGINGQTSTHQFF